MSMASFNVAPDIHINQKTLQTQSFCNVFEETPAFKAWFLAECLRLPTLNADLVDTCLWHEHIPFLCHFTHIDFNRDIYVFVITWLQD